MKFGIKWIIKKIIKPIVPILVTLIKEELEGVGKNVSKRPK